MRDAVLALEHETHGLRVIVKWFLIIIIPLVFAASTFSVIAYTAAQDARHSAAEANTAIDLVNTQRTEARKAGCEQDNVLIGRINGILDAIAGQVRSPEAQAFLRSLLVAERDCTPAGLEDYFTTSTTTR